VTPKGATGEVFSCERNHRASRILGIEADPLQIEADLFQIEDAPLRIPSARHSPF
jgi:hypothetical protein